MKTKLLEQPIQEKTIIRDKGVITETYNSLRWFEMIEPLGGSAIGFDDSEPLEEVEKTDALLISHEDEICNIQITDKGIFFDTPRIHACNWWGMMNQAIRNVIVKTYIQDILDAGYSIQNYE